LELPAKMRATLILREAGGMPDDIVVGDVLIASPEELDGEN
jgi:hypothetical protein